MAPPQCYSGPAPALSAAVKSPAPLAAPAKNMKGLIKKYTAIYTNCQNMPVHPEKGNKRQRLPWLQPLSDALPQQRAAT